MFGKTRSFGYLERPGRPQRTRVRRISSRVITARTRAYRLRAWRREKKYYDDGRCLGVTQSRIDLNPGTVVALRYRGY